MAKNNYYVVIRGQTPGIYDNWAACEAQVKGFSGALYKGCSTIEEAAKLLESGKLHEAPPAQETQHESGPRPTSGIAVDGACSGNPGPGEFQAVDLATEIVHKSSTVYPITTNNAMEFVGAIAALNALEMLGSTVAVYTDSQVVLSWIQKGEAKVNPLQGYEAAEAMNRANAWLRDNHRFAVEHLRLWDTKAWGENPADFGRK